MAKKLTERQTYVCASPHYLARHGQPQSLEDLKSHNCLLGTVAHWRFASHGREEKGRFEGNLRYNSGTALLDAAIKGIGIVQLPDFYVRPALEQGTLISILDDFQPGNEAIWAVYPNNRQLSSKIRHLIDHLAEQLAD